MAAEIPQAWVDTVKGFAAEAVYSVDNQGKWEGKAGSHVPQVSKNDDGSVTVKVGALLPLPGSLAVVSLIDPMFP